MLNVEIMGRAPIQDRPVSSRYRGAEDIGSECEAGNGWLQQQIDENFVGVGGAYKAADKIIFAP